MQDDANATQDVTPALQPSYEEVCESLEELRDYARRLEIELTVTKYVMHFFLTLLNPRFRGPTFDFATFDIKSYLECAKSSFEPELTAEEFESLQQLGEIYWKGCIRQSGILEWNNRSDELKAAATWLQDARTYIWKSAGTLCCEKTMMLVQHVLTGGSESPTPAPVS